MLWKIPEEDFLLDRTQCYEYVFLFARLADLAKSKSEHISEKGSYWISRGKEFMNYIESLRDWEAVQLEHLFRKQSLKVSNKKGLRNLYEFLIDEKTRNDLEGPSLDRSNFPRFKRTIDKALDKMANSEKARELISYVFGNLAYTTLKRLDHAKDKYYSFAS